MRSVELILYNKNTLQEFIDSELFGRLDKIPIVKHRAVSQIQNPRAGDEDVLLAVQYDHDQLIGYIGAMPDFVFDGEHEIKMAWLTAYWVSADYRGTGVAENLFNQIVACYDNKIMITNLVPFLEAVYQKKGIFVPTYAFIGKRYYLRSNMAEILPPKKNFFKQIMSFLKGFDFCANIILNSRIHLFYNKKRTFAMFESCTELEQEHAEFLNQVHNDTMTKRGVRELNWICKHPWVIESFNTDERYYFSSLAKTFSLEFIILRNINRSIEGIALLSTRNSNLNVQYVFFNENRVQLLAEFLIQKMIHQKLNMITTFDLSLTKALDKAGGPFYYSKSIRRPVMIGKCFEHIPYSFQAGDGDVAFY